MGVIYKLKDDVIAFILEQKKNQPALSCRQLAQLATQQFQIDVSKSSVNNLLKDAQLSSPIGRRPSKTSKFEIPAAKKEQMADHFKKAGELMLLEKSETPPLMTVAEPPQQQILEKPREMQRLEDVGESKPLPVSPVRPLQKNMGLAMLKALQWEKVNHRALAEFLKKYSSQPASVDFAAACEVLLFLQMLGTSESVGEDEKEILKTFHENFQDSQIENMLGFRQREISENMFFNYLIEKEQMFFEVSGFRFAFDDNTQFFIDSHCASVWSAPAGLLVSNLEGALDRLSKFLVSNYKTPFFMLPPNNKTLFSEEIKNFISFCEVNSKRQLKHISVLDNDAKEIVQIHLVPLMRRNFSLILWPGQKEFDDITKASPWAAKKILERICFGQRIFYTETRTNFFSSQLNLAAADCRVLTFYDDQNRVFGAVVTNDDTTLAAGFIRACFLRWPNFDKSLFLESEPTAFSVKEKTLAGIMAPFKHFDDIFQDLAVTTLDCESNFQHENKEEMVKFLRSVSGHIQKDSQKMVVSWQLDASSANHDRLERAARSLSERNIFDPQGRKVLIQIL